MTGLKWARRGRLELLCATAMLGVSIAPAAHAQAQNPNPGTAREDQARPNGASTDNTVADIVVTAEKRSESLQNIPIPITALTAATLERAGISAVGDLVQLAPSLQFGTRSTNVFIALRGIGQAGQDIGSQSGVTVSLDGVPLLSQFMMNPAFLDLERVEVLRGPQGTIQGRNATGGAININSKAPTDQLGGDMAFTVGDYSRIGVTGDFNAPLSDTLSARLSFQSDNADGWLKNGYNGTRYDNTNLGEVRGQLLFKPTTNFSVRAIVDYTHIKDDPEFNVLLRRANPNVPTAVELPGYPYPQNDIQNLTVYMDEPNHRSVEDIRGTVIARYEFGNNASITSTTGFIKHDIELTDIDVDLTPANTSSFPLIGIHAKQVSQELTLTTDLGSHADLIAGLFYMHGVSSEPLYLNFPPYTDYLIYLPVEKLNSYAGYAQFRYRFTDNLRFTAGGRYTIDDKSYTMNATVLTFNTLLAAKDSWKAFTPRFVLDYTPNATSLIYASASRGFKSGGFNTLGDITQPVNFFNPEYVWNYEIGAKASLFDKKLRVGLTGFYADYTNLQQTVFIVNPTTNVSFPKVENSSKAAIKGVEFEFEAAPVNGLRLTGAVTHLIATFGKFCNNDPTYPNVPTSPDCVGGTVNGQPLPPGAENLQGNTLTQAPKWQFNASAQYTARITPKYDLIFRADYKWQSTVYFDIYNNPQNSQAGYGLLNGSLTLAGVDKVWSLAGWVHNAFDKRYIAQANVGTGANPSVNGNIGTPRMYGATLTTHF